MITTRQRDASVSPSISDESLTGDSYVSSDTEESLVSTKSNSDVLKKVKISIRPIFIKNSSDWRRAAPNVFKNSDLSPETVCAKATSDGFIIVKTREPTHYRQLQKILLELKIPFQTSKQPEERTLKVVLRGIPIDITPDDIKNELVLLNFDVKLVKRFGPPNKPMPICLSAQISTKHTTPALPAPVTQPNNTDLTKMDYATATKYKEIISNEQIIALLTDLLMVISTTNDPKEMLNTIKKNAAAVFYRCSKSQYNHLRSIGQIIPPPPDSRYKQRPRAKLWKNQPNQSNILRLAKRLTAWNS
ncbi:hypothetical protein ACI65C_009873 [Semiaphis heraclei]